MDCSRSGLRLLACLLRCELSQPNHFGWDGSDGTRIVADLLALGVGAGASISMIRRGSTEYHNSPPEDRS